MRPWTAVGCYQGAIAIMLIIVTVNNSIHTKYARRSNYLHCCTIPELYLVPEPNHRSNLNPTSSNVSRQSSSSDSLTGLQIMICMAIRWFDVNNQRLAF